MSPLAENNKEHVHSDNQSKNTINAGFKRRKTQQMFSGVLSCSDTKHKVKQTHKPETALSAASGNKQQFPGYMPLFNFVF